MKKILLIANHPTYVYTLRKEIIEGLLERKCTVAICCPYGEAIDYFTELGCIFYDSPLNRHGKNIFEEFKLKSEYGKVMDLFKPDFVLTFTIKPNLYAGMEAAKREIPYIANITGLGTPLEKPGLIKKILINIYKYSLRKADSVMFQNTSNMKFFKDSGIKIKNPILLPGSGVNTTYFNYLEYPESRIKKFVFISRVMKEKGIDEYLAAAKEINRIYPNTEFHICGFIENEYRDEMENWEKLGYIKYHGMVKDIRTILKQTHCTIHPSFYPEGMSNVLLESASSGRPIITTNRPGCREIVDNRKENGYIIEPQNVEELVNSISNFMNLSNEEQIAMGMNGREFMIKNFDRNFVVEKYIERISRNV